MKPRLQRGSADHFGLGRGCDEWHNPSVWVATPLGGVAYFHGRLDRTGDEHVYAMNGSEPVGRVVEGCDTCAEIIADR